MPDHVENQIDHRKNLPPAPLNVRGRNFQPGVPVEDDAEPAAQTAPPDPVVAANVPDDEPVTNVADEPVEEPVDEAVEEDVVADRDEPDTDDSTEEAVSPPGDADVVAEGTDTPQQQEEDPRE